MIKRLVLENWRSHERSEFEFGNGTNVLVGDMGSGKTSAMDAVCFALFGTFPALQSKKIRLDEVIRNKPEQQKKAKVILDIETGGENYRIKRVIELGKGTVLNELWKGETLIEGPQNARTTERVQALLKINYDLFSRAVYAEQNNIEYFLEIPKSQRKQKIDELLKISKFENARKNLSSLMKQISEKAREREKTAEKKERLAEMPVLEKEIGEKLRKKEDVLSEENRLKLLKKTLDEEYERISLKRKKFEELDSLINQSRGRIQSLEQRLAGQKIEADEGEVIGKISLFKTQREEAVKTQKLKEALQKKADQSKALAIDSEQKLKEVREKIQNISVVLGIESAEAEEEKYKKQVEILGSEIEDLKASKKSLESQKEEIRVHELENLDVCPTCETELTPEKKQHIISKRTEKLRETEEKMKTLCSKIEEMSKLRKTALENMESMKQALKKADERKWLEENAKNQEAALEKNKALLKEAEEKLAGLKIERKSEDIADEISRLEKTLGFIRDKKELSEAAKTADSAGFEMAELGYSSEEEKQAYEKVKNSDARLALLNQEKAGLDEILNEKTKRLNELKSMEKEIKKASDEKEKLVKINMNFEILENTLRNAQSAMRQEFTDTTNNALAHIWGRIYPYGDYTDLKLGIDETGDYILQLKTNGEKWVNVEGVTSGGERSIAALALRISLSLVLTQNLSLLVLDEPTHNLDKNAVGELASTLREHLPSIVDQIFIITHEPLLEEAASAYLYKLDRVKELNEPTKVIAEKKG